MGRQILFCTETGRPTSLDCIQCRVWGEFYATLSKGIYSYCMLRSNHLRSVPVDTLVQIWVAQCNIKLLEGAFRILHKCQRSLLSLFHAQLAQWSTCSSPCFKMSSPLPTPVTLGHYEIIFMEWHGGWIWSLWASACPRTDLPKLSFVAHLQQSWAGSRDLHWAKEHCGLQPWWPCCDPELDSMSFCSGFKFPGFLACNVHSHILQISTNVKATHVETMPIVMTSRQAMSACATQDFSTRMGVNTSVRVRAFSIFFLLETLNAHSLFVYHTTQVCYWVEKHFSSTHNTLCLCLSFVHTLLCINLPVHLCDTWNHLPLPSFLNRYRSLA